MNIVRSRRYASGSWLRCVNPRPDADTTVVAFPHAGGSSTFFHSWGTHLPPHVELKAVQYPGRLDRLDEPCLEDVHLLAAGAVDALLEADLPSATDRRLVLFGHSMGAVVAFEATLLLESLGHRPEITFLSSHPAPGRLVRGIPPELSDEALVGELRRLRGTPASILDTPVLREVALSAMRGDYRAVASYGASPGRTDARLVCFVGDRDPDVSTEDMTAWAGRSRRGVGLTVFPGDHFYLVDQRDAVIDAVATRLTRPHSHPAPARVAAPERGRS